MYVSMLLSQGKASFGGITSILRDIKHVAGLNADSRAPFGHKQSFWWKQVCLYAF